MQELLPLFNRPISRKRIEGSVAKLLFREFWHL
jgi:hypothetical protein